MGFGHDERMQIATPSKEVYTKNILSKGLGFKRERDHLCVRIRRREGYKNTLERERN